MPFYVTQKCVLEFSPQAVPFLRGLTSQDLDQPQNAFLTRHGRIVAVFHQRVVSEDKVVTLIETGVKDKLFSHCERFLALNPTRIQVLPLSVFYGVNETEGKIQDDEFCFPWGPGFFWATARSDIPVAPQEEWTLFRIRHHLPLQGQDYNDEFVLNVDENLVSFTKGCFLGQEPVAKVHNRSCPTWRLEVKAENDVSSEDAKKMTSVVTDSSDGQKKGFLFVRNQA